MDKKIIKKHLTEKFSAVINEDKTPGIDLANKMKKEETKINKDGVKAIETDVKKQDKNLKKEDNTKKFNYSNDTEKEYHDEMETRNGLEMTQFDREPNKEYKDRAKKAIIGDPTMGNGKGANAEEIEGVSSDDFGKEFIKKTTDSKKKRDDAEISTIQLGDDIETLPKNRKSDKYLATENKKITKNTIEPMKRLKFKKEFNGIDNALKLIPESYKINNKEFEMTDGNETYKIRWEGTLTEGQGVVLLANNKKIVNEDIDRMKALFNYKSSDTLGLVKGAARIDENKIFFDVLDKTKKILSENEEEESDDDAPEVEDNYYKTDDDDSSPDEKEPSRDDVADAPMMPFRFIYPKDDDDEDDVVVPKPKKNMPKLMRSKSTGKYFIVIGNKTIPCPEKYVEIAKIDALAALESIKSAELNKSKSMFDDQEDDELDEGLFSKSPEELKKIGIEAIKKHPVKSKTYQEFLKKDPEVAEKYVLFVGKNPDAKYIGYDDKKKEFNLTGKYSVASGEGTSGS